MEDYNDELKEMRDMTRIERFFYTLSHRLFLLFCRLLCVIPILKANAAGRISTAQLVRTIYSFCELYSGKVMFPYQEQFSKRVIRSVIENDGEEITALFSRQSGKSETISLTSGGMMIILPTLANMPMFADDPRLQMFKDGLWIGIFAPGLRQAQITYSRIKTRIQSKSAQVVLADPSFNLQFTTSNGQTVSLSNGSFVTAISASDNANIEGESFHVLILEECQDISNFKIRKCLTGDTQILLSDGTYKRLDEVVKDEKDKIVCFDDGMNCLVERVPRNFYTNGLQDVYKVTLDDGSSIKATLNHQFYTYDQKTHGEKCAFRTLERIQESMSNDRPIRIAVPDAIPYFAQGSEVEYFDGLIVGYFLGDGCTVGTPKFIGDIPTNKRLHEVIKGFVDDNIRMTETNYNPDNGMQEVCFSTPTNRKHSNTLSSFFVEYEMKDKTGENKKLPDKLFSKPFYRGLVEALIETDGCVESCTIKPVISFSNISKDLVYQLRDILLRFGIHPTVFVKDNTKGISKNSKPLYNLQIKSVRDIRKFHDEFVLYRKQVYLEEAYNTVKSKEDREVSKYYPDTMRFCRVKSIEYVGKEETYCLRVEGRNFIANGIVSSNSIHPMGAAYNASIIKIGTATTHKGDFYDAIQRNKERDAHRKEHIRNHFEYNCVVASKYNARYAKYVEKEKARLGENSDEFRMAYMLEWIIERGMFVDINIFEAECGDFNNERVSYDKTSTHVAGIDLGGKGDDTWITMVEVDWSMPAILESRVNEDGEEEVYEAYNTYIKDWHVIHNQPDYEQQYPEVCDYLDHWRIARIVCDATREASFAHRLRANRKEEVIPYIFTTKSKSEIYKHLDKEISSGRARFCNGEQTRSTPEYKSFMQQMGDLQKGYSGQYMVVAHPDERDAHDDACDSWALAVWGTSFKGEVSVTETKENVFTKLSARESARVRAHNRITARRRR